MKEACLKHSNRRCGLQSESASITIHISRRFVLLQNELSGGTRNVTLPARPTLAEDQMFTHSTTLFLRPCDICCSM